MDRRQGAGYRRTADMAGGVGDGLSPRPAARVCRAGGKPAGGYPPTTERGNGVRYDAGREQKTDLRTTRNCPHADSCILIVDDNVDAAHSAGRAVRARSGMTSTWPTTGPERPGGRRAACGPDIWCSPTWRCPAWTASRWRGSCAAESPLRDLALIAVSGFGNEDDRQRSRAAGFDHHLASRPIRPLSRACFAGRLRRRPPDAPPGRAAAARSGRPAPGG